MAHLIGITQLSTSGGIHKQTALLDANLPTTLNMYVPISRLPVVESEYGEALAMELKVRAFARKNTEAARQQQKSYYNGAVKDSRLKAGDLVMLKVRLKFKLDRKYKGLFVIKSITNTNAVIILVKKR